MPRIQQSFCYMLFMRDRTMEQVIQAAADIGYAAVELWGREHAPFDELCALAGEHGLTVASMVGHASLPDGLNRRENHTRIQEELHASIEVAAEHGIPGLICFSGNRGGLDDEHGAAHCIEGLNRVKSYAEKHGVNLNLELLNSKVDHPDYQCDHTPWGVRVVQAVDSPNVKLLYDIYHMQIMEGDLIRTIRENVRYIGHFHTAGNPGRRDMDASQEIWYPAVMRAIAESGYGLYVGHEFHPKGDGIAALRQAYETCNV
jgi:hydroxypyruvate isomerase